MKKDYREDTRPPNEELSPSSNFYGIMFVDKNKMQNSMSTK